MDQFKYVTVYTFVSLSELAVMDLVSFASRSSTALMACGLQSSLFCYWFPLL